MRGIYFYRHYMVVKHKGIAPLTGLIRGGKIMRIKTETIVRTIIAGIALLNSVLIMFGKTPLDLDENTLYVIGSGIATVVTTIWAWWKNNSFTQCALQADEYLNDIRHE